MDNLDKIPSRIKYYLLDYKDKHMEEFINKYGEVRLRDLTLGQLQAYFSFATSKDYQLLNK